MRSTRYILRYLLLITFAFLLAFSSCRKKDDIDDDPSVKLAFSTDSIIFDTVFTTVGSVTKYLTVYNRNDKSVKISTIRLIGGSQSPYRINIDGDPAVIKSNVEIAGNDSLFMFVRVVIDPNNTSAPFIVSDQIEFETNGNLQDVDLMAYGQNAIFFITEKHQGFPIPYVIVAGENEHTTWTDSLPIVIYNPHNETGFAVVDSTGSLTITEGAKIYFHNQTGLWVYRYGTLKVKGTKDSPVTFQGDRLEPYYQDLPGQWDRIWINEGSIDNEINYAIIKNGFIGIQAETFAFDGVSDMQLLLSNTIIDNMTGIGLLTRFYKVFGYNNVISNCGEYGIALTWGGVYDFRQCTFANYWNSSVRQSPNLFINNYYEDYEGNQTVFEMNTYLGNCINYGDLDQEFEIEKISGANFTQKFENCLLRTTTDISDQNIYPGCIKNEIPEFVNIYKDYHLDTLSPATKAGNLSIITPGQGLPPYFPPEISNDLDGINRTNTGNPDIGAYQFVPGSADFMKLFRERK